MTLKEAKTLVPGQKLQWARRPDNLPKALTIGAYPYDLFAKLCGEIVEFVKYTDKYDKQGFPLIIVKTKTGEGSFNSSYLECLY